MSKRGGDDSRIDWMYQGDASKQDQEERDQESFLLGKEYNPSNVKSGDLAGVAGNASIGINRIIENSSRLGGDNHGGVGGEQHHQTEHWSESFRMKHEDPMFMVNNRRREKERDRQKKKDLFEKTATLEDKKHYRRSDKRKRRKKERRRGRSRSRSSSLSVSSSSISSKDERRRRRKKKEKKRRKRRRRSYSSNSEDSNNRHRRSRRRGRRERSISRSRSRSSSMSERKSRRYKKDKIRDHHSRQDRSQNRSRSRSRSTDNYDRHVTRGDNRRRDDDNKDSRDRDNREKDEHSSTKPKLYGLLGSNSNNRTSTTKNSNNQSLGPDGKLLAKKRREKDEARHRYRRGGQGQNQDSKMSHEERLAALDAMQEDASNRTAYLSKASAIKKVDLHDEEIQRRMREGSKEVSSFVQDMVMKSNSLSNENSSLSMAKHLAQNRNKIQKSTDERFL